MPADQKAMLRKLRVDPGSGARLSKRATDDKLGLTDKLEGQVRREELVEEMRGLHDRLWAEASRSVLLVLQGMDTSGKDGTIRRVFSGVNPQGCRIASFKTPTVPELEHDYLWRIHAEAPERGKIGIFNRSHYEDVVAARLVGVVDGARCKRRFQHIQEWERALTDEGTTVVKVFLHISPEEQRLRLQARLDDPTKRWKFSPADVETRTLWPQYVSAYEEAITATSTAHAPWYVVPADRKWVRDVAVASLLVSTLRELDPQYPQPQADLDAVVIP
jgi:PPK2 family polyphosphate:nucleotide phosphotransferase